MGAEDADRLSRLDQQRLVVFETLEARHDGVERFPVAGGPTGAAVDDQIVGILGDLRIEVVLQAPEGCLLKPAFGVKLGSPMGSNRHRAAP